ncbi:lipase [Deltaproteobacteria bacterium Smac51]|nr:lipase [Deltaproteobacteria bacterium Smac51]
MEKATSKKPHLTKGTKEFVEALEAKNAPPLYTLTYEEARQVLIEAQSGETARPEVDIDDLELPAGPSGKVDVRIVRLKNAPAESAPFIVYFHGGGWVMGNKKTHDRLIRELTHGTGCPVVFVNYTPSPEAQYPKPLEEAFGVVEYFGKNGAKYSLDPAKMILAGDSVGGNMAIVCGLMAARKSGPRPIAQVLFYPVTDAGLDTESYQDFADGPWLTKKAMEWFWDAYLPDKGKRGEITASPLQAGPEDLKGLAPALVFTAENDVLRDEAEAFALKLDAAGVKVAAMRVGGTIHDFVMLDALAETAPARAAMCLAVEFIKKAIQK